MDSNVFNFKKSFLFLVFVLLFAVGAAAQITTVSVTVVDENGLPIPGANVVEKGTVNAVSTDFDGRFAIRLKSKGAVLVFTFLGDKGQEVVGVDAMKVLMKPSTLELGDVVVTALGIKKDKKALGYAATEVQSKDLVSGQTPNVVAYLSGRVAGVNIAAPISSSACTTKIVIRGNSQLSGNNQPLFVIDGVPMDNTNLGGADQNGGYDLGDGLSSLNP